MAVARTVAAVQSPARALPKAVGVVGFALLTALLAQVTIPVPGSPVPITLQTLAVTLAPLALGAWGGAASMALYLAFGLVGLPVYAGASGGWQVVQGATFGYLLGFVLCQPAMAWALGRAKDRAPSLRRALASMVVGHAVVFALGLAWLWVTLNQGERNFGVAETLSLGLWPYLPGSVFKSALALLVARDLTIWARRQGWR
ncbi:MAG TPA: biotin transporter BioY [Phycisphaerales bacterium]|nr:biotin transporter BioY [Phycisphaerales bacterium]